MFDYETKVLFIWRRASPGTRAGPLCQDLTFTKIHSITYNVLSSVYMRAGPARLGEIPPLLTRDLG